VFYGAVDSSIVVTTSDIHVTATTIRPKKRRISLVHGKKAEVYVENGSVKTNKSEGGMKIDPEGGSGGVPGTQ